MSDRIVVVDYDPLWPEAFERERERIAAALGADALAIEHYGSTAVEGIPAKPIIDVMVVVQDLTPQKTSWRASSKPGTNAGRPAISSSRGASSSSGMTANAARRTWR